MDLSQAMTPVRTGESTFTWAIPDGWQQGKGAFGGLVAGAAVRAAEAVMRHPISSKASKSRSCFQ